MTDKQKKIILIAAISLLVICGIIYFTSRTSNVPISTKAVSTLVTTEKETVKQNEEKLSEIRKENDKKIIPRSSNLDTDALVYWYNTWLDESYKNSGGQNRDVKP